MARPRIKKTPPVRVLFVCIGNSCRSPMAEAISRRDAAGVIESSSAGFAPLGFVAPMTKLTLKNNGYPADGLESKPILREALNTAELVVNMSGRPRVQVFPRLSKVEDWEVEDPFGSDPEAYQRIFEEIRRRVAGLAARLKEEQSAAASRHTFLTKESLNKRK